MKRTKLILGLLGMLGLLIATGSFSIAGSTGVFSDDKEIRSHEALSQEPKLLTFQVLSDLHIEKGDKKSHRLLRNALEDYHKHVPDSKLMVLNGDLTGGMEQDYEALSGILSASPHPPLHAVMGNHDYYQIWRQPGGSWNPKQLNPNWSSEKAKKLFLKYFPYKQVYHETWINGFQFIFLGSESYRDDHPETFENAYLSNIQLAWLEKRLKPRTREKKDSRKPVFVFLHQPLPFTLEGTDKELGITQHKQLRAILDRHPKVVFISGHTHYDAAQTKQFVRDTFMMAGCGSVRLTYGADNEPIHPVRSQSLTIDVTDKEVIFRVRDHTRKEWAGQPFVYKYK